MHRDLGRDKGTPKRDDDQKDGSVSPNSREHIYDNVPSITDTAPAPRNPPERTNESDKKRSD